jgi:hypothetical protein
MSKVFLKSMLMVTTNLYVLISNKYKKGVSYIL